LRSSVQAVEIIELEKGFGRKRPGRDNAKALDSVTFDVGRGECVGILGQNG
jgi:ABC-type multidrug transport system ATPase subunit